MLGAYSVEEFLFNEIIVKTPKTVPRGMNSRHSIAATIIQNVRAFLFLRYVPARKRAMAPIHHRIYNADIPKIAPQLSSDSDGFGTRFGSFIISAEPNVRAVINGNAKIPTTAKQPAHT